MRDVFIAGVGLTAFGKHLDRDLGSLCEEALGELWEDAGAGPEEVGKVYFGNAAAGLLGGQEMIRGQVALKGAGLGGCGLVNVENACASGGSAAHLAWLSVASGEVETALAVGAEKLIHPDKQRSFAAIESGTDLTIEVGEEVEGSIMMSAYARMAREYESRHGPVGEALAAIAVKNREHAAQNPKAQFREPIDAGAVAASRLVADPLRLLTCSPLTDGAGAILFSARGGAVAVKGSVLASSPGPGPVVGRAADAAYAAAGFGAAEVDVFALHDACAYAELAQYEQVGIAAPGAGAELALAGETSAAGRFPVNTDGGLLSRGHALGATGIAQLADLAGQLRGTPFSAPVPGARRALAINSGGWMGSDYACAVATALEATA